MNRCFTLPLALAIVVTGLALEAGCTRPGRARDPADRPAAAAGAGEGGAFVASLQRGVRLHRCLDRPHRGTLAATLAPFSTDALGLSDAALERLRREGLRLAAVPVEQVPGLMRRLAHEPRIESIHMGIVPEWRAAASAPRIDGSKFVRVGGEIGAFADGRFRLLLRAYPVTLAEDADERLRLEMMVQFHQPRRDPISPDPSREERMGVYIPTSAFSIDLDGGWAVVVTAENPDVSWRGDPPPAGPPPPAPSGDGAAEEGARDTAATAAAGTPPAGAAMGPQGPRVRTSGEEALISPEGDTRFVLIFVPRVK